MVIDVDRIAELSKLIIPQEKKQVFEKHMTEIVAMADVLSLVADEEISTSDRFALLRADAVHESGISPNDIINNAPCFENSCFCVPKTVE